MTPEQIKEFYDTYFYYILAAGFVFGLLIGAIPLILGMKKGKRNLGIIAFVLVAILGAFSPLLSILVAVIFTVVIIVKSKAKVPTESDESASTGSPE